MDYKVIYTSLAVIFSVNIMMIGLGVYNTSDLAGPFSSLFNNLSETDIKSGTANLESIDIGYASNSADSYNQLPMYKTDDLLSGTSTIIYLVTGFIFGYTAIFSATGSPYLISLLFIVIISIYQAFMIVYIIKDIWGAIWGNK